MKSVYIVLLMIVMCSTVTLAGGFCGGKVVIHDIIAYDEVGEFSWLDKGFGDIILKINSTEYPDIDLYINGNKLNRTQYEENIYLYSLYPYESKKVNVEVKQNNELIYSAKWKIKNVTFTWYEMVLPLLTLISVLFTLIMCVLVVFKKVKVKYAIISSIVTIIIFYLNNLCS